MYTRKQFGLVFVIFMLAFAALFSVIAIYLPMEIEPGQKKLLLLPAGVMLMITLLFKDLTVTVDEKEVTASFGVKLFKKKIPLNEIVSCKKVRNRWYYGYGIRYGRGFVLYNISGLDAVELEIKGKKRKVRIGTDEPDELCAAITSRLS
jgi:hypothetical protein